MASMYVKFHRAAYIADKETPYTLSAVNNVLELWNCVMKESLAFVYCVNPSLTQKGIFVVMVTSLVLYQSY